MKNLLARWYFSGVPLRVNSYKDKDKILLSSQNASASDSLDLLFCSSGEESGLDNDWLLGENTLAQNLVKSCSGTVNDRSLCRLTSILSSGLLRHQGPQFVKIDSGLVKVGVVGMHVEVPHSNLSEVSRMVFVKVDSVVMLTTSVSTTSGMLPPC